MLKMSRLLGYQKILGNLKVTYSLNERKSPFQLPLLKKYSEVLQPIGQQLFRHFLFPLLSLQAMITMILIMNGHIILTGRAGKLSLFSCLFWGAPQIGVPFPADISPQTSSGPSTTIQGELVFLSLGPLSEI